MYNLLNANTKLCPFQMQSYSIHLGPVEESTVNGLFSKTMHTQLNITCMIIHYKGLVMWSMIIDKCDNWNFTHSDLKSCVLFHPKQKFYLAITTNLAFLMEKCLPTCGSHLIITIFNTTPAKWCHSVPDHDLVQCYPLLWEELWVEQQC